MDQALFSKLHSLDRRSFLRNGLTAAGFAFAAQGSGLRTLAQTAERKFAPVRVSRDRIIREIVGLRPFRPEGFVVEGILRESVKTEVGFESLVLMSILRLEYEAGEGSHSP